MQAASYIRILIAISFIFIFDEVNGMMCCHDYECGDGDWCQFPVCDGTCEYAMPDAAKQESKSETDEHYHSGNELLVCNFNNSWYIIIGLTVALLISLFVNIAFCIHVYCAKPSKHYESVDTNICISDADEFESIKNNQE
eukprot:203042_1